MNSRTTPMTGEERMTDTSRLWEQEMGKAADTGAGTAANAQQRQQQEQQPLMNARTTAMTDEERMTDTSRLWEQEVGNAAATAAGTALASSKPSSGNSKVVRFSSSPEFFLSVEPVEVDDYDAVASDEAASTFDSGIVSDLEAPTPSSNFDGRMNEIGKIELMSDVRETVFEASTPSRPSSYSDGSIKEIQLSNGEGSKSRERNEDGETYDSVEGRRVIEQYKGLRIAEEPIGREEKRNIDREEKEGVSRDGADTCYSSEFTITPASQGAPSILKYFEMSDEESGDLNPSSPQLRLGQRERVVDDDVGGGTDATIRVDDVSTTTDETMRVDSSTRSRDDARGGMKPDEDTFAADDEDDGAREAPSKIAESSLEHLYNPSNHVKPHAGDSEDDDEGDDEDSVADSVALLDDYSPPSSLTEFSQFVDKIEQHGMEMHGSDMGEQREDQADGQRHSDDSRPILERPNLFGRGELSELPAMKERNEDRRKGPTPWLRGENIAMHTVLLKKNSE